MGRRGGRGGGRGGGGRGNNHGHGSGDMQKRILNRDFREPREDVWEEGRAAKAPRLEGDAGGPGAFDESLSSPAFEDYYKAQGIVPEAEWAAFMAILRTPLPVTFRINGSGKFAALLRDKLQNDFFSKLDPDQLAADVGEALQPPRPLAWYPDNLAWHMSFSRAQLRKSAALASIHDFMVRENEAGTITRQEAVSMIPPLVLRPEPEHAVFDMCAAPGSKTAQLIEMLHARGGSAVSPDGFIIANDADPQRCHLLVHQTKRMCSPALVVTNHDAQRFPAVRLEPGGSRGAAAPPFDRILADVPCSGDGTLRKAPDMWRKWQPALGNGLHRLQLSIVLHGARLLKVGGRLVYSTCSLNPIEDEAVVAELLRRTGGALELLDCTAELPGLVRMPGLRTWKVRDKVRWHESMASVPAGSSVVASMFPDAASEAFPLDRCMRVLPHHSDTGGFFIAVFSKVAPLPADAATEHPPGSKAAARAAARAPAKPCRQFAASGQCSYGARCKFAHGPSAEEAAAAANAPEPATADAAGAADAVAAVPVVESEAKAEPAALTGEGAAVAGDAAGTGAPATEAAAATALVDTGVRGGGGRGREGGGGRFKGLDPVIPLTDPAIIASIEGFYGIGAGFPLRGQLFTRSEATADSRPKRVYYVSSGITSLLKADEYESLKITSTGLKLFERQEQKDAPSECAYRICQEGMASLLPHMSRQIVRLSRAALLQVLTARRVLVPPRPGDEVSKPAPERPAPADGRKVTPTLTDPEALTALAPAAHGCCVLLLRDEDAAALPVGWGAEQMAVSVWRGRTSLALLVSRAESDLLLEKLTGEKPSGAATEGGAADGAAAAAEEAE